MALGALAASGVGYAIYRGLEMRRQQRLRDQEKGFNRFGKSMASPMLDLVDEAAMDSFPCSDPPSFSSQAATPATHE